MLYAWIRWQVWDIILKFHDKNQKWITASYDTVASVIAGALFLSEGNGNDDKNLIVSISLMFSIILFNAFSNRRILSLKKKSDIEIDGLKSKLAKLESKNSKYAQDNRRNALYQNSLKKIFELIAESLVVDLNKMLGGTQDGVLRITIWGYRRFEDEVKESSTEDIAMDCKNGLKMLGRFSYNEKFQADDAFQKESSSLRHGILGTDKGFLGAAWKSKEGIFFTTLFQSLGQKEEIHKASLSRLSLIII